MAQKAGKGPGAEADQKDMRYDHLQVEVEQAIDNALEAGIRGHKQTAEDQQERQSDQQAASERDGIARPM